MQSRLMRRWAVPAGALAAVAIAGVTPNALAASGRPSLPARSAAYLLAAVERSHVQALSGTVRTTANLGLPTLPDRFTGSGSGVAALLAGTHTLRIWVDGPDRQRVAMLGDLSETDVVHNGADTWVYTSSTQAVLHRTAPARGAVDRRPDRPGTVEQELTPQAQAQRLLQAIDPSTAVTVDRTARVAGRPAYQLMLTPRTSATLVRSVRITIDAATWVPLRVQVFAAGHAAPAFETTFTKISFHRPAASVFRFAPPRGATVTSQRSPAPGPRRDQVPDARSGDTGKPTLIGTGWTTVLALPAGSIDLAAGTAPNDTGRRDGGTRALLDRMSSPVAQGRLISTRLLSVLITPDGRVLVGAVPPAAVEQAAAG